LKGDDSGGTEREGALEFKSWVINQWGMKYGYSLSTFEGINVEVI
jgi:hypothetical protein